VSGRDRAHRPLAVIIALLVSALLGAVN